MKHSTASRLAVIASILLAVIGLAGCSSVASSSAMCAYIAGNGSSGNDAELHEIVYPGQSVDYNTETEVVSYVPCNSRNYITNAGDVDNANGDRVGDRFEPTVAYLPTGEQIKIWSTAYWTLNQANDAMTNFYALCYKYTCASDGDEGGDVNFSTPGWNGMLSENFGPSIDLAASQAAYGSSIDADIYKLHDPSQYEALGVAMSELFSDIVRAKTGYSQDLFCGSGNSGWADADKPGEGDFTCTQVRIVVDRVELGSNGSSSQGATVINQQRLTAAQAIYGDNASYWLALQDTIAMCRRENISCVIGMGDPATIPGAPAPVN